MNERNIVWTLAKKHERAASIESELHDNRGESYT